MSNIKISNLPLIPSVSPDDVLPIVDSGFTTTYKVKVSSLQGTSGTSGVSGSSGTSGTSGLGFTWQGGWQSITTYFINDVVYYSGASYVALGTIAAGGNPPDVNASWENMNAQGASGSSGTSGVSGSSGTSGVSGTSGTDGTSGTSGTSGQSNDVYSGGTLVVPGATILNFSGATITSGGTGEANIVITPSSNSPFTASGSTIYPADANSRFLDFGTGNTYNNTNNRFNQVVGNNNTIGKVVNLIVGNNNTSTGGENRNSGLDSNLIVGYANINDSAYSSNSAIIGNNNTGGGWSSLVVGQYNQTGSSPWSVNAGSSNSLFVEWGYVFGNGNTHTSQGGFTIGQSNNNQGYAIAYENQFICGLSNQTIMAKNTAILGGTLNQINGIMYDSAARPYYDAIIGGNNNKIGTYITGSTIVGSSYSSITGSPVSNSNIIGGTLNKISAGNYNSIIGGNNQTISSGNGHTAIGGATHNIGGGNNTFLGGGENNTGDSSGSCGIIAGKSNFMNGVYSFIGGGLSNNISNAYAGAIVGGTNNQIWQTGNFVGGGNSHLLYAYTNSDYCGFIGGNNNEIGSNSSNSTMLGGTNNTITATSPNSSIIGGSGSTISGHSNTIMIGTKNRTSIAPDSTHLEKLILMTPLTEYANNGAAKAGGLLDGQLYRDSSGGVHIVFT